MKAIETILRSVNCDAPGCGYSEPVPITSDERRLLVDKPCPKCGSVLVTATDFIALEAMLAEVEAINSLVGEIDASESERILIPVQSDTKGQFKIRK